MVADQLLELVEAGLPVSTSCEEMMFPWRVAPQSADELDKAAKRQGVCLYATGVNPGFVIDRMPAALLRICTEVRAIRVRRVQDTLTRRQQLRQKTGAGLTTEQFRERVADGLGHVGLVESLHFIARAVGRTVEHSERHLEPVTSTDAFETPEGPIAPGVSLGARERIEARLSGGIDVELILEMAVGSRPMTDRIEIDAVPPLRVEFAGGVPGREATASALVAGTRVAESLAPGVAVL